MHRTLEMKLNRIALLAVALGASTGIAATTYAWLARGEFTITTLVASLIALAAAFPVWNAAQE